MERHIADAVSKGATVVCGGKRHEALMRTFYTPTILTGCVLMIVPLCFLVGKCYLHLCRARALGIARRRSA